MKMQSVFRIFIYVVVLCAQSSALGMDNKVDNNAQPAGETGGWTLGVQPGAPSSPKRLQNYNQSTLVLPTTTPGVHYVVQNSVNGQTITLTNAQQSSKSSSQPISNLAPLFDKYDDDHYEVSLPSSRSKTNQKQKNKKPMERKIPKKYRHPSFTALPEGALNEQPYASGLPSVQGPLDPSFDEPVSQGQGEPKLAFRVNGGLQGAGSDDDQDYSSSTIKIRRAPAKLLVGIAGIVAIGWLIKKWYESGQVQPVEDQMDEDNKGSSIKKPNKIGQI